jgi:flagellar hook-associated protein 1 FlgK
METRDTYVPSYIAKLDTIAADLITAVNGVHSAGFGLDNISGRDFFTGTNAATIAVNTVLVANPDRIATAAAPNQPGDSSIALAIAQLRTTMSPATDAAYASLVSVLGVDSRTEQDRYANLDTLTRIQDRRRANVSGVSLDEEAADMVRYQRAYEAAARVLTTYDQLLDTLINRTGLAGR